VHAGNGKSDRQNSKYAALEGCRSLENEVIFPARVNHMDKLKTILTLIAIILGGLVALAAIGLIYNLLGYLLILSLICLGGYIAFRFLTKPDAKQVSAPDPKKELQKVQRLLDEYKRKQ
jgi:hypothetical protein